MYILNTKRPKTNSYIFPCALDLLFRWPQTWRPENVCQKHDVYLKYKSYTLYIW